MTLSYYGDPHDQHELKALSLPEHNTFWGTYFTDMVKGVAKLGYHWNMKQYVVTEAGYQQGLTEVIVELQAGRPVIINIPNHAILAVGIDLNTDQIALLDPDSNIAVPGVRVFNFADFDRIWHEDPKVATGRFAIFTAPKDISKASEQKPNSGPDKLPTDKAQPQSPHS